MGYAPDPFLRALIAYRGNVLTRKNPPSLAYITNWTSRWGWKKVTAHPEFYLGAQAKAAELGFGLDHFWLGEPGLSHARLSRILTERGISGVIIASHVREIDVELRFDWTHLSAVKIDYLPHRPELHNITNNHLQIIRLAMQKVMAAGYRRIGFVMNDSWDAAVDHLWRAGFLWEQQGLPAKDRIPPHMLPDAVSLKSWCLKYQPEVVISKAEFVLPTLAELGWRIPRKIAFVDLFLEDASGATAGVRQNHATVGELAVEMLAGQLAHNKVGIPPVPTTTYVEGIWTDGASCPAVRV
jgi:LacI family transcriptional regulator